MFKLTDDGTYRQRVPPKISWINEYGWTERPVKVVLDANGLIPVMHVSSATQTNTVVPDIVEIGGIEDLRVKRMFYEAILLACTHADFQGKRILALEIKSPITKDSDKKIIEDICREQKKKWSQTDLGKLNFYNVIEALFRLSIIDKNEFDILNELRNMGNGLRHNILTKYSLDIRKANQVLKDTIQILLRLRELPICISEEEKITGYEWQNFWEDVGYIQ